MIVFAIPGAAKASCCTRCSAILIFLLLLCQFLQSSKFFSWYLAPLVNRDEYYAAAVALTNNLTIMTDATNRSRYTSRLRKVHPYAGARGVSGEWEYVHDPTVLRRHPPGFSIAPEERREICASPGQGPEGSLQTFDFLTNHLTVRVPPENFKLFCAVYTYPGAKDMTQAATETWAKRCDGFMAASYYTDPKMGIVHIPHAGNHSGEYAGIWQKVRSMLTYMSTNFGSDYDYFHINGDDVYLIVENLKAFLADSQPDYVGQWIPALMNPKSVPPGFYYAGGGSGYTLSRSTLRRLVDDLLPTCYNDTDASPEDFFVAHCLWEQAGVKAAAEWDARGAHRYNGFEPDFYQQFSWSCTSRKCRFWKRCQEVLHRNSRKEHPIFRGGGIGTFVSNESASFHLIKTPALMRRMERLIYHRNNDNETLTICASQ